MKTDPKKPIATRASLVPAKILTKDYRTSVGLLYLILLRRVSYIGRKKIRMHDALSAVTRKEFQRDYVNVSKSFKERTK